MVVRLNSNDRNEHDLFVFIRARLQTFHLYILRVPLHANHNIPLNINSSLFYRQRITVDLKSQRSLFLCCYIYRCHIFIYLDGIGTSFRAFKRPLPKKLSSLDSQVMGFNDRLSIFQNKNRGFWESSSKESSSCVCVQSPKFFGHICPFDTWQKP